MLSITSNQTLERMQKRFWKECNAETFLETKRKTSVDFIRVPLCLTPSQKEAHGHPYQGQQEQHKKHSHTSTAVLSLSHKVSEAGSANHIYFSLCV